MLKYLAIISSLLIHCSIFSQDVEQVVSNAKNFFKQDPFTLQGGIGANMVFYDAKGIANRRDPFYWALNGNLNITILGKISCPLTFTLTQQDKNFTNGLDKFSQPFNQFGISPKYKWLTVHAGYRTMEFSEHSLSGSLFLGGGVEIAPTKGLFSGSAAFGRFLKAIPKGGVQGVSVSLPAYERWGGAAKLKFGKERNNVELIYFRAADNKNSIPFDTANAILPAENQIFGLKFVKIFGDKLTFQGAYHYSMLSTNTYLPVTKIERFTYINKIFSPRANSRFNSSYLFQVDYDLKGYRIGAKFKRVDPDYASLGAVFITNDVQEISGSLGKQLLKNKLNLNVSVGVQQNNLDRKQIATQRRVASSASANISLIKNTNINLSYNNFSTDVVAIQDVFYDSIRLTQVNETGTASINYSIGKEVKQTINLNTTYQESGGNKQASTAVFMLNPSYNLQLTKQNIGFTVAGSFNTNAFSGNHTVNFGPTVGVNTTFFKKKCKVGSNFSYQNSTTNDVLSNRNYAIASFINYSITKSQVLKISHAFVHKKAVVASAQDFIENRLTIAYNYSFGTSYRKLKTRFSRTEIDE